MEVNKICARSQKYDELQGILQTVRKKKKELACNSTVYQYFSLEQILLLVCFPQNIWPDSQQFAPFVNL